MTGNRQSATLVHSVVVQAPVDKAFKVFTEDFGRFKPPDHNLLDVEVAETIFELRVGGHLYDRGVDGSECRWAQVLVYDPPRRVRLTWNISPSWQLETDPARLSEWEVRFSAEGADRTRVVIEHHHLERHGEGWEGVHSALGGPDGWPLYFARYSDLVAGRL